MVAGVLSADRDLFRIISSPMLIRGAILTILVVAFLMHSPLFVASIPGVACITIAGIILGLPLGICVAVAATLAASVEFIITAWMFWSVNARDFIPETLCWNTFYSFSLYLAFSLALATPLLVVVKYAPRVGGAFHLRPATRVRKNIHYICYVFVIFVILLFGISMVFSDRQPMRKFAELRSQSEAELLSLVRDDTQSLQDRRMALFMLAGCGIPSESSSDAIQAIEQLSTQPGLDTSIRNDIEALEHIRRISDQDSGFFEFFRPVSQEMKNRFMGRFYTQSR